MWIDAVKQPPTKAGWYMAKLADGSELKVPFARTYSGSFVWVLPDSLSVCFWREQLIYLNT